MKPISTHGLFGAQRRLLSFFIISIFLSIHVQAQTYVEKHGQLSVKGNRIVDKDQNEVQLRGMSLFWSQWMGKYYTANTVKWLKNDWCTNVIRAAMGVETSANGYAKNETIAAVERAKMVTVIDAAIEEGMYVIVDFHVHKGDSLPYREAAARFFKDIASTYGDVPNIIYETWNEPLRQSWASIIKPYHIEMIDTIRKYAPNSLIVCAPGEWAQRVQDPAADPINRPNIAYTLHYYADTHKQWLRDRAANALSSGIALFVTEYGTCNSAGAGVVNETESVAWWNFLDQHKISHCNWSIADKVETASAITPNTSPNGNWTASNLTESGLLVRNKLLASCDLTVGLADEDNLRIQTSTYPNPFTDSFSFKATGAFEYVIYDLMGTQLEQGSADGATLIGSNLNSGTYVVKITGKNDNGYVKVTKK